jgi:hypothetical protein
VRQFWRLQEKSRDIKGLRYLSLSKVAGEFSQSGHRQASCLVGGWSVDALGAVSRPV